MTASFQKHLDDISRKFPNWDEILGEYLSTLWGDEETDIDEDRIIKSKVNSSSSFHYVLADILQLFISYGRFKDEWDLPPMMRIFPFPPGQEALASSKKLNEVFSFGFLANEFFVEAGIVHPENIKHMPDEFWTHFFNLFSLGNFKFEDNAVPDIDDSECPQPQLLKSAKSTVYRIIRNCILLEQYSWNGCADLGSFWVSWPQETDWRTLIEKGCEAFKNIYGLNYMLYRHRYRQRKSIEFVQ
jgi:hypothetical protein